MTTLLAVALGVVFLVSGAAKVRRVEWIDEAAALGAPRGVARALPVIEIAVGACLAAGLATQIAAVVAGALLVAFTAAIVRELLAGRRPPCACFGGWSRRPVGWRHLVRNGALVALAFAVAVR